MSTRQYIGARYVPKFFDFGGSPEWRSGVAYEALTIVTRSGNSYTSKIPVPSNIGAPESNPDYWVSTGIYNQQIESIREAIIDAQGDIDALDGRLDTAEGDIDTLESGLSTTNGNVTALGNRVTTAEGDIDNLEASVAVLNREVITRRYVLIGDSYSVGSTSGGFITGWSSVFKTKGGLSNTDCYIFDYGGSGFIGRNSNTFTALVNDNADSVTNKNTITDVVFCGGFNDTGENLSSLRTAIYNAIDAAKTQFPNANIWVGCIGYSTNTDSTSRMGLTEVGMMYKKAGIARGANYIVNSEYILATNPASYMSADTMHPTQGGYDILGALLYQAVNDRTGVVPIINEGMKTITFTPASGITVATNTAFKVITFGATKRVLLEFVPHTFTFATAQGITSNATMELGTFDSDVFGLNEYRDTVKTVRVVVVNNDKYYNTFGNLFIRRGKLELQFSNFKDDQSENYGFAAASEIAINPTYIDQDLRLL